MSRGEPQVRTPHRRRASAILALVLAATGLGLTSSPVSAAECPDQLPSCIVVSVVKTVDGTTSVVSSYTVTPTDLQTWSAEKPDLNSRKYLLRKNPASKGGKLQTRPVAQGTRVSLNALLAKKLTPEQVTSTTFAETPNAAGVPAVLSAADLVDPDKTTDANADGTPDEYPFFEKLQPAVVLLSGNRIGYIRPLRDPDEDTNASDYFQVTGRLDLTVHTTGTLLAPTVASSAGTALERGGKTTFSVAFADEPRTGIKSTLWDFGDGSVKNTKRPEPSKSYAKQGTYPVVVTVRANDGSYGRSPATEIKVANPPKAPTSGTGGGSGDGGSGGSGGSGLSGGDTSSLPPYDPFPDELIDPPTEIEEPPLEPEDQLEPLPVDDGLEPVEGYVLAGAEIVPGGTPETIPGTENSAAPAPATQQSLRTRVATWTVATLAVALLVGIGAASETRWFRHRLRHLRRRA
jgi:hypothetical protein